MAAVGWSSRTRVTASPLLLRLRLDDEVTLRFVFNDWEGVAGVKSNHAAQVEGLMNGIYRRATALEARRQKRLDESRSETLDEAVDRAGGIRLALAESNFRRRTKLPHSERGWSTITAKPTRLSAGGFPMKTITVPGDRNDPEPCIVTVGAPEQWALMPAKIPGPQGPLKRRAVIEMFRALQRLNDRPGGARMLVVLHLLYGPRSPNADYLTFGEVAPIVHMTPAAIDVTDAASERQASERADRFVGERDDRDAAVAKRQAADRSRASARTAVDEALHTGPKEQRKALRDRLSHEGSQLRTRALNALRSVMEKSHEHA